MIARLMAVIAGAAALSAAGTADASAQTNPFARMVDRETRNDFAAAWYERADGDGRFVFDQVSRPALVWREDSDEVIAVYPARAAGGGEIWLTDTDDVLLRFSNLGGATYFPEDEPDGVLVDIVAPAEPLRAEPVSSEALAATAEEIAGELARMTRGEVTAQLTALSPEENGYMHDTLEMVVRGAEAAGRGDVRDLRIVRIGIGERPRAVFEDGVLDISISPSMGYGGRPSSDYIRRAIERGD